MGARVLAGMDIGDVCAPIPDERLAPMLTAYGVLEVERAAGLANNAQSVKEARETNDPRLANRFAGYVDTCLRREFPTGNPHAHTQNNQRRRKVTAARPGKPEPPPKPPPAEETVKAVKAVRKATGLNSVDNPIEAYMPPQPKAKKNGSNPVNTGFSKIEMDKARKEIEEKRVANSVQEFMDAPDTRNTAA